ncbi:LytR C-terminal domain-containing protein [Cumulibacter manganitolerans]|uniref:LytR C-terminal domain-containing protein n=1 Tax=Cumulibacter manganitolerans TaxID=1884992 RepID=UPI0012958BAA|nr:LytR C-terminal domain-containing protein [Cumulibacter manganitolerans]
MLTAADVRRRRIGGAVAAVIGIVLIVLAVLALTGKLGATGPSKGASDAAQSAGATSGSASGSSGASKPADAKAPLTVLNASSTGGLAAKGKAAFEKEGWQVTQTGNLSGSDAPKSSTVYYPAGDEAAHAAAQDLVKAFPKLTAAEAPAGFKYSGVVVVMTGDWTP